MAENDQNGATPRLDQDAPESLEQKLARMIPEAVKRISLEYFPDGIPVGVADRLHELSAPEDRIQAVTELVFQKFTAGVAEYLAGEPSEITHLGLFIAVGRNPANQQIFRDLRVPWVPLGKYLEPIEELRQITLEAVSMSVPRAEKLQLLPIKKWNPTFTPEAEQVLRCFSKIKIQQDQQGLSEGSGVDVDMLVSLLQVPAAATLHLKEMGIIAQTFIDYKSGVDAQVRILRAAELRGDFLRLHSAMTTNLGKIRDTYWNSLDTK